MGLLAMQNMQAQSNVKIKYEDPSVFAGIEVGSKGVKLSIVDGQRAIRLCLIPLEH